MTYDFMAILLVLLVLLQVNLFGRISGVPTVASVKLRLRVILFITLIFIRFGLKDALFLQNRDREGVDTEGCGRVGETGRTVSGWGKPLWQDQGKGSHCAEDCRGAELISSVAGCIITRSSAGLCLSEVKTQKCLHCPSSSFLGSEEGA